MRLSLPRWLAPTVVALSLTATARAEAPPDSPVHDEAELFSPATIAEANRQIDEIRRALGVRLFVDTVKEAPEAERKRFRFLWSRQVNQLLAQQAEKRAQETGVPGIYIVICLKPKDVHVITWPADEDLGFSAHDCEALRREFVHFLRQESPDKTLLAAIAKVRGTLEANRIGAGRSRTSEFLVVGLIAGLLALSAVLYLARRQVRRSAGESPESAGQPDFQAARWGSMFGMPAALWAYDRLFRTVPTGTVPPPSVEPLLAEDEPAEKGPDEQAPADDPSENAPVTP
jgi:phosphatidylserine decarboxylase